MKHRKGIEASKPWNRGFTVIELAAITVVVVVLAAILSPVFARTNEKGKEGICRSNMRYLSVAFSQYLQDWNGCFPDHASVSFPPEYVATGCNKYVQPYTNYAGSNWINWFEHRYRYKQKACFR